MRHGGRAGAVGLLVAIWSTFDAILIGLPILGLAAALRPVPVFIVASVVVTLVNIAACSWVDRQWESWVEGTRFESRMQRIRSGKRARRPVEWISRGSVFWFALAAMLLNAVQVTALIRLATGQPADRRRIVAASLAYSILYAGVFTLFGWLLRDAISAL
jgi:hypothetical protein